MRVVGAMQGCRGIGDKALVQIGATCPVSHHTHSH